MALRKEIKELRKKRARDIFQKDLEENAFLLDNEEFYRVDTAITVMDGIITTYLKEGGSEEEMDLWQIHREYVKKIWANRGRIRHKKAPVHPTLLNWAITFLAKTSASIYKDVENILQLPEISYISLAGMVSTMADR